MMRNFSFWLFTLISIAGRPQQGKISIIPEPLSIVPTTSTFVLKNNFTISVSQNHPEAMVVAKQLQISLSTPTGFSSSIKKDGLGVIQLVLLSFFNNTLGNEGYKLLVNSDTVIIQANRAAGLFYGYQTFLQLLPKDIENRENVKNINWTAPGVEIVDKPRFGWRGMMFDVSRHFFTKAEVKQFIDDMVKYKFNMLHWHLTDDEGWRIEIKSLPKLTEVGAWRANREGKWANTTNPFPNEPKTYGGFYTQEDIKEIVNYAKDRFVTILPEIDVPGHSLATVAAYPELSCSQGPFDVSIGALIMTWYEGGHDALVDNTLCPANEAVYSFLDKVFTEVAQLFPFEYIHMGGDETAKNFWKTNEQIKGLMKREGLKDMSEVQSYFVKRVEKIISSKGKKLIGWDEIIDGRLPASATVMSWRGMDGGVKAAKMGHQVVMAPTSFVYLDYYQGEQSVEPPIYAGLRMKTTYQFEPVPQGVNASLILGGQANLWTERLKRFRSVQYMLWPRALAVSEAVWSVKEKRNWNYFVDKVIQHFERLDAAQTRYARSIFDPIITTKNVRGQIEVSISGEIEDIDTYYSIDETIPDNYYPKYSKPIILPHDAAHLKLITYRYGKQVGQLINLSIEDLKKRVGK